MNENLRAFLEMAKDDPELQDRLSKMVQGELVAAAKEKGVELSEEDFHAPAGESDENELNNVAGGGGGCFVLGGGGGTNVNNNTYGCGCAVYGQGGDCKGSNFNCTCILMGAGNDYDHDFGTVWS